MTNTFEQFTPLTSQEKSSLVKKNKKKSQDEGVAIIPVPDKVPLSVPWHKLGQPSINWVYRNAQGRIIFYVFRFILPNGDKEDRPLTYRKFKDGSQRWAWKGVEVPRPLYGLDRLDARPDAPVLVCEGEKATEAALVLFPDYVAMTSPNGAGSPHKADWSAIVGRQIIFWPDQDDDGRKYSRLAAQCALKVGAVSAAIVQVPDIFPDKWDLADKLPDGVSIDDLHRLLFEARPITNPLDGLIERATINPGEALTPEVIEALSELQRSDKSAFENLRSKLKKIPIRVVELDKIIQDGRIENGEGDDHDHLELARLVIGFLGKENLLSTEAHVWHWHNIGVWKTLADRGVKQKVQTNLEYAGSEVSRSLVDAVADVLKTEIYAPEHEWNINQDIVNVMNGELRWTGEQWELQPHCREHYRTTQVPVCYDPQAACPRFIQFLDEIFVDDADATEKSQMLLEMIGYTLVSHARFEKFALLVGTGANGKSVVMEVVRALVGPGNIAAVQPSQFTNRFQRAHLHLKLANLVTEIAEGAEIADAELKAITSGELTTAEHKNKDPFNFSPFCTCWFGTNHMPHTRDFSDALFRRALVIPFNRTFRAGVDADSNLKTYLCENELPGVMNIALSAFGDVMKRGTFTEPRSCLIAKQEWRLESDQVAQFVQDICALDAAATIKSSDLYGHYKSWCDEVGISRKLNRKNFTNRLMRLGCRPRKGTGGQRMIDGIKLATGLDAVA